MKEEKGESSRREDRKVLIISTIDHPELLWNAFRLGIIMLEEGEEVTLFLNGPSVKYQSLETESFPFQELAQRFVSLGGELFG